MTHAEGKIKQLLTQQFEMGFNGWTTMDTPKFPFLGRFQSTVRSAMKSSNQESHLRTRGRHKMSRAFWHLDVCTLCVWSEPVWRHGIGWRQQKHEQCALEEIAWLIRRLSLTLLQPCGQKFHWGAEARRRKSVGHNIQNVILNSRLSAALLNAAPCCYKQRDALELKVLHGTPIHKAQALPARNWPWCTATATGRSGLVRTSSVFPEAVLWY